MLYNRTRSLSTPNFSDSSTKEESRSERTFDFSVAVFGALKYTVVEVCVGAAYT